MSIGNNLLKWFFFSLIRLHSCVENGVNLTGLQKKEKHRFNHVHVISMQKQMEILSDWVERSLSQENMI